MKPDIEKAIKEATKEYLKATTIGKATPLTILRAIYRQAFLDGSRWAIESIGVKLPKKQVEK